MGTIQTAITYPPAKAISVQLPIISVLESKVAVMGGELDFYHQLLSWLLFSCDETKRSVIETFRAELADLRNGGFSALREGLDNLKNEIQDDRGHPDLFSDVAHLQLYLNHIDGTLQSLKTKIQGHFSEFIHVRIW
jgi:hypothetical protein